MDKKSKQLVVKELLKIAKDLVARPKVEVWTHQYYTSRDFTVLVDGDYIDEDNLDPKTEALVKRAEKKAHKVADVFAKYISKLTGNRFRANHTQYGSNVDMSFGYDDDQPFDKVPGMGDFDDIMKKFGVKVYD